MEEKQPKGKGIAALLVAKMKPKASDKAESEHEDSDYEAGKDAAVEDIIKALDEKDPDLLKEALTSFISHC